MHGDLLAINVLLLMNNDLNFPNNGKNGCKIVIINDKETKLIFHFFQREHLSQFLPTSHACLVIFRHYLLDQLLCKIFLVCY